MLGTSIQGVNETNINMVNRFLPTKNHRPFPPICNQTNGSNRCVCQFCHLSRAWARVTIFLKVPEATETRS